MASMKSIRTCAICSNTNDSERVDYNIFYRQNLCSACDRKINLQLRQDHPEYFLKYCGVPRKYLTCSLDNFKGNDILVERFQNYVKLRPLISLMLIGVCGNGKTHLAVAILRELVKMNVNIQNIEFVAMIELLNQIKMSYDKNSSEAEGIIINRYTSNKLLVIDDFGYDEEPTNWQVNLIYLIIDRMIRDDKILIITMNNDQEEIEEKFGTRIADRLAEIKSLKITMDSYRKRRFWKVE